MGGARELARAGSRRRHAAVRVGGPLPRADSPSCQDCPATGWPYRALWGGRELARPPVAAVCDVATRVGREKVVQPPEEPVPDNTGPS